jgi:(2R)-sulfolactate sulfo-lyase subunit alpha
LQPGGHAERREPALQVKNLASRFRKVYPQTATGARMIHFVVHDEHDSVGVVVVEGVKSGQELIGWIMDQDKEIRVKAENDIPIGHKLAIKALNDKDTVIKYGVDIGRTVAPIKVGEHAHVHNIKTKRW